MPAGRSPGSWLFSSGPSLPSRLRPVTRVYSRWGALASYSGGSAPDFHRLPFSAPRRGHLQDSFAFLRCRGLTADSIQAPGRPVKAFAAPRRLSPASNLFSVPPPTLLSPSGHPRPEPAPAPLSFPSFPRRRESRPRYTPQSPAIPKSKITVFLTASPPRKYQHADAAACHIAISPATIAWHQRLALRLP